jgi:hypothetical protein
MKVTMEFNLPDENDDCRLALDASEFRSGMNEFEERLRFWRKHGHPFKSADDAVEKIAAVFFECKERFL